MHTRKFCIVGTERTGSNFIRELLQFVPGVSCHGELFNSNPAPGVIDRRGGLRDFVLSLEERNRDPLGFLSQVERLTLDGGDVCGFKLMMQQQPAILDHVLVSEDYQIIIVSRRNKLAQYSSDAIARASGVWAQFGDAKRPQTKVVFDMHVLTKLIERHAAQYRGVRSRLEANQRPHFSLEYTEIKTAAAVEALMHFIGIAPPCPVAELIARNRLRRQNTANLLDRFTNPEAVVEAMRQIGHEDWLTEEAP